MITNYTTRTRVLLQAAHLCQLPSSDFLQRARTQVLVRCGVPSLAACQVRKKGAPVEKKRQSVRTGTRTQNLLLRRQAPYPLGHTDNYEMLLVDSRNRTRHSSLGVEHSLSKRKVVGSNPACGFSDCFFTSLCAISQGQAGSPSSFLLRQRERSEQKERG